MVLLDVLDFEFGERSALYEPAVTTAEALLRSMDDKKLLILPWTDPSVESTLCLLEEALGDRLLIPLCWSDILPQASALVTSALSGGDIHQWFAQAKRDHPGPCWLWERPISMKFPLPCPTGQGAPLLTHPDTEGFYSASLGCYYYHEPESFVLYDTRSTMEQKRNMAKDAGFQGTVSIKT